jgi:hypothetical protein
MNEKWAPIPGYPDYAVSTEGRIWNTKLNREVAGYRADGRTRISMKNEQGGWDSYRKDQILNSVDFVDMATQIPVRKVRDTNTGEIWENADDAIKHLHADRSEVYKVLRGQRPHVRGAVLEYFYVQEALG